MTPEGAGAEERVITPEDRAESLRRLYPSVETFRHAIVLEIRAAQNAASSAATAKERERCVRAMCVFCRSGVPVNRNRAGLYWHAKQDGWEGDYANGDLNCRAQEIRERGDSQDGAPQDEKA